MERITAQNFDRCPLLKEGFAISGRTKNFIYISNPKKIAVIMLLECAKCPFNKNGCKPYANIIDIHEIMAKVG